MVPEKGRHFSTMIKLTKVTKRFGAVTALDGVTLHVEKGEFVLITGPSGAGKSTMLRLLFAAVRPDEGAVCLMGRDVNKLSSSSIPHLRRAIGVIFQDFKLLPQRSALENVALALEIQGLPRREIRERSLSALSEVSLLDRINVPVSALSGGEQQRVAIARGVVGDPSILLADEPTGNLDPELSHDVLNLLTRLARCGTTIVAATHDPLVLEHATCTRVLTLDRGRLAGARAAAVKPRRSRNPSRG